jgi:hypothetical protein
VNTRRHAGAEDIVADAHVQKTKAGDPGAVGEDELGSGRSHAQKINKDAREEPDGSAVVGVERVVGKQLAEDAASREPRVNGENEAEAGDASDGRGRRGHRENSVSVMETRCRACKHAAWRRTPWWRRTRRRGRAVCAVDGLEPAEHKLDASMSIKSDRNNGKSEQRPSMRSKHGREKVGDAHREDLSLVDRDREDLTACWERSKGLEWGEK